MNSVKNEEKEPYSGAIRGENLARRLLLIRIEAGGQSPRECPSLSVVRKARRKLLKTERLRLFHFEAKMPIFRQVSLVAKMGSTLGRGVRKGALAAPRYGDCSDGI